MLNEPMGVLSSEQALCEVCSSPLSHSEKLFTKTNSHLVCSSFECNRIILLKPSVPPALYDSQVLFQRKLVSERRELEEQKKKKLAAAHQLEQEENLRIYHSVMEDEDSINEENSCLVSIPHGRSEFSALDPKRIENYTSHLKEVIRQAEQYDNAEDVKDVQHNDAHKALSKVEQRFSDLPELRQACDKLCMMCKGGCCSLGGDIAFISVMKIRRVMDANPELSGDEILESYVSCIAAETAKFSCINQVSTGCALPRELRSDVCNSYYCPSLKSYQQRVEQEGIGLEGVVVIQRRNALWDPVDLDIPNTPIKVALTVENGIREIS